MKNLVVVRHKVHNYRNWKKVFDDNLDLCREYGLKRGWVYRNADDPNELIVSFEVERLSRAREFFNDPSLRQAMDKAGVAEEPTIFFLEEAAAVPELATAGQGRARGR